MYATFVTATVLVYLCNASPFDEHKRTPRSLDNCSTDYTYTIESYSATGRKCMSDCTSGSCITSWTTCEACVPGQKTALTYHTSRNREQTYTKCLSRCGNFGEEYSWCVVDNNDRKWDYCNDDTENRQVSVDFSTRFGPCRTECDYYGQSYLWCWTWWGGMENWDYCEKQKYSIDQAKTAYGKQCRSDCKITDNKHYYWCYDSSREANMCAPSPVINS